MTYTAARPQTGACIPVIQGRNLNVGLKVMPCKP